MNPQDDIITGGLEYFSALFWNEPHTWNTPSEEEYESLGKPEREDEEW